MNTKNHYGLPIADPATFTAPHTAAIVPLSGGSPPVCSCGWTRFRRDDGSWIELYEHIRDQNPEGAA